MNKVFAFVLLAILLSHLWGEDASQTVEPTRGNDGGTIYTKDDSTFIVDILSSGMHHPSLNGDREGTYPSTCDVARRFLGRPYVAHTLEVSSRERLVVNTRQLDCTTLVETVAAIRIAMSSGSRSFDGFCEALRRLRYRQGRLSGYTSRLHYFSDWIIDNSKMGFVRELQTPQSVFSSVQTQKVNFMSTHPQSYRALREHPEFIGEIRRQEQSLTGLKFRYIPKSFVKDSPALRRAIHDGDIIAITCNKPGLEIAHLGFAVWQKDGLHLLNASQIHHKVVVESMTLGEYLQHHPSHTGIRVIRLTVDDNEN